MNTSDLTKEQRTRLDSQKGWLVEQAEEVGQLAGGNKDWTNQIRGLLDATAHENEPAVIANLLRYQSARVSVWKKVPGVAAKLLTLLDDCSTRAEKDKTLELALIQHLFCYTYRAYTYHSKSAPNPAPEED